jgi:aromatic ring-opening dioxygenase LigB subunit
MPLVFAAIMPHGFPIIPELSEDAEGGLATRRAMAEAGSRALRHAPEAVMVAGPHGVRVDGAICLADVARAAGTLHWQGNMVEMNVPVDAALTDRVADEAAKNGVPIARAGYAGNRRDQSVLPLDWGVITPLWFLGHDRNMTGYGHPLADTPPDDTGPSAVIATPSRSLPRQVMVDFGQAVGRAIAADPRPIAFIASCDWAHTHREDGPYGFDEAADRVDQAVVSAVEEGELHRLIDLPADEVRRAAIDGLWQTLMLAGVLDITPLKGTLLNYEAPCYYGMLVATYE